MDATTQAEHFILQQTLEKDQAHVTNATLAQVPTTCNIQPDIASKWALRQHRHALAWHCSIITSIAVHLNIALYPQQLHWQQLPDS